MTAFVSSKVLSSWDLSYRGNGSMIAPGDFFMQVGLTKLNSSSVEGMMTLIDGYVVFGDAACRTGSTAPRCCTTAESQIL